ncbi:unnamed protein product [Urochloa humidicola]
MGLGGGGSGDAAGALRGFLREAVGGCAVVDGGLAPELEAHGADLQDALWSAKCLATAPHLIRKVHLDYLEAGANIITSASYSYQATIEGLQSRGFSREESEALLRRSVHVAQEARRVFVEGDRGRPPVLVAASVGSYGAYLADGSEYSGDYGSLVTKEALKNFHRRRLQVLADAGPDLIAFETIPNKLEAQAYAELLEESDIRIPAWLSFTSKDGTNAASGDPIAECAAVADSCQRVSAVGVNCTAPRLIHGLILSIKSNEQADRRVPQQRARRTSPRRKSGWTRAARRGRTSCRASASGGRRAPPSSEGAAGRALPRCGPIARALHQADADEYNDIAAVAVL